MIIDVQHHYVPRQLAVQHGWSQGRVVHLTREGQRWVTIHDRLCDLDWQLRDMDAAGVDAAVLSSFFGWDAPAEICQQINDDLAEIQYRYRGRFFGFAHIPLGEPDHGLRELMRAVQELRLVGVTIMSQVEGHLLDDPWLWPFYDAVQALDVPIYVHPVMYAGGHVGTDQYDLGRIIGREFDLITCATRLIAGGVLERFPRLRFIISHFGGGIAAVKDRIRKKAFRFNSNLPLDFDTYFNRLYFDTAGFEISQGALRCALTGIQPERLVFGTDYPQDFSAVATDTGVQGEGIRAYIQLIEGELGHTAPLVLGDTLANLLHLSSRKDG